MPAWNQPNGPMHFIVPTLQVGHVSGTKLVRSAMQPNSPASQIKVPKRLYTVPEAAQYLGRSSWSVRRLIWSGALPEVRAGRRIHLDIKDMDTFIDRNKQTEEAS